jgi:hypothetical protein
LELFDDRPTDVVEQGVRDSGGHRPRVGDGPRSRKCIPLRRNVANTDFIIVCQQRLEISRHVTYPAPIGMAEHHAVLATQRTTGHR